MKKIPEAIYKSPEEIEAVAKEREAEAVLLPAGKMRQSVLMDAARLRSYAEMKRLLA